MDTPSAAAREDAFAAVVRLLGHFRVEYALFHHRPVRSYEDAALARAEAGFVGTEGKCLVLRAGDGFVVCTTLQGRQVDLDRLRDHLSVRKVRLATPKELRRHFGAEPGNAYPFGFDAAVRIIVDPVVYAEEWLLFSPALSTATVQVRGRDLARLFRGLPNPTAELPVFATG